MTPETCNSPDKTRSEPGTEEAQAVNVALDAKAFELALKAMNDTPVHLVDCDRCKGKGFHHGFGEDGCDPDWCGDCGGGGCVPAEGEETRPLKLFLQTYLTATAPALPQDVAALVDELESRAADYRQSGPSAEHTAKLFDRAAIALRVKSSTIASAREVIEPFAAAPDNPDFSAKANIYAMKAAMKITYGHLRAAREWKGR